MKKILFCLFFISSLSLIAQEKIEIEGAIKLGNTSSTDNGTIRYTGSDFEGRNGGTWQSLLGGGGGSSPWSLNSSSVYYDSGNVGIGTSTPELLGHVHAGNGIFSGSYSSFLEFALESNNRAYMTLNSPTWQGYWFSSASNSLRAGLVYNVGADDVRLYLGGTEEITFDPNGYVGLGTNTPAKSIDLAEDGADIRFSDSNSSAIQWYSGGSEQAYLTHNSPDVILHNRDSGVLKLNSQSSDVVIETNTKVSIGENPETAPEFEFESVSSGASRYATAELFNQNFTGSNKRAVYINTNGSANEPYMYMYRNDGTIGIQLDVDVSGDARIVTDELLINGGSDFAEHFDIIGDDIKPLPGMVVSIDPNSTGKLTVSHEAYDRKVAGIISGANGVETGVMMGQVGSIADGDFPIALSGRVYVYANNEGGEILPGDMLTTSSTRGFAMKASNYQAAQGAVIGKAMTKADDKGFVLVLVNLQ